MSEDLAQLLANPESVGSAVALAAGLGEKVPCRVYSSGVQVFRGWRLKSLQLRVRV